MAFLFAQPETLKENTELETSRIIQSTSDGGPNPKNSAVSSFMYRLYLKSRQI